MPTPVTIVWPYYRQPQMLLYQLRVWNQYPSEVQVILVDDGSPESALPVVMDAASTALLTHLRVYRILEDIPWNREEVRNLGATEAKTEWIIELDLDHVVPLDSVKALLTFEPHAARWYRFHRWRRGQADETRQKDAIPATCAYGPVGPHMDGYLVQKAVYWQAGGYNELFCGVLGGGSEFLERLQAVAPWELAPPSLRVEVVTRAVVPDASITTLSRDTGPGKERGRQLGRQKPSRWLVQPWERIL